ncbi:hypothetical protein FPY71_11540 [Aureimonas fodinaquatilis]|uniref:Uncharacterized protein n=1 Tax=Aureimonas fodinaquatilis TaxID=2565783 RepID=A0A5B0DZ93_9HYPH|nr:hypothetical protein [Aureimonas fodinaquatilis]KAA0971071.1 hypothetical protein FPY71_11540 [Aureimonas fodinaquatilis]
MSPAIGLAIGIGFNNKPPGPVLDPDAMALIARMSVEPNASRKLLISNLIKALKAGGVWSKLDAFYVLASHDAQAARLNWVSGLLGLSLVASPVFTVDRGYKGDGVSAYLAIASPLADSVKFQLTDASAGLWAQEVVNTANKVAMAGGASAYTNIYPLNTAGTQFSARTNSNSSGYRNGGGTGMFHTSRVSEPGYTQRHGLAARYDMNGVAYARAVPERILAGTSGWGFSEHRVAAAYFGAGMTVGQEDAITNALSTYMTAVGAA